MKRKGKLVFASQDTHQLSAQILLTELLSAVIFIERKLDVS
jgi:hypothetical protein